jgi:hypothetical protein
MAKGIVMKIEQRKSGKAATYLGVMQRSCGAIRSINVHDRKSIGMCSR